MHTEAWTPRVRWIRGGDEPGQTHQTLTPCACSRSRSWLPEPAYRSLQSIREPMRGSSLAPLGQRLAGLVEDPPLLAPQACRGLGVHRIDGLRVLCVIRRDGAAVSCSSRCCSSRCCSSQRHLAMDVLGQPLCAPPLPQIQRPQPGFLRRRQIRRQRRPGWSGDGTQHAAMARGRWRVECDVHTV